METHRQIKRKKYIYCHHKNSIHFYHYGDSKNLILFFSQSQKTFWLSKISTNLSYMQSFRQIGPKLWKIGAIQNRYPIVVYGVMSDSESKNPRPL